MTLSQLINGTNVRYYARFGNNSRTVNYCVLIKKVGYLGASENIPELASEPMTFKHVEVEGSNIIGSEMTFSFISRKIDFDEYDLLSQGNEYEYTFHVYNESNLNAALWNGYISPGETERAYFKNISVYNIVATDYLAKLKNIEFSDQLGQMVKTRKKVIDVIGWILAKLPGFTGYYAQCGIKDTNMLSGLSIAQAHIYPKIYSKLKNGLVVGDSCYDTLDNVLKAFCLKIHSPFISVNDIKTTGNPKYIITNVDATQSPFYWVSYTAGACTVVDEVELAETINIDSYSFSRDSEFTRKLPLKTQVILQHNYDFGTSSTEDDLSNITDTGLWQNSNILGLTYHADTNLYERIVMAGVSAYTLTNPDGNKFIRISFKVTNYADFVYQQISENNSYYNLLYVKIHILRITPTSADLVDIVVPVGNHQTINYVSPLSSIFEIVDGATYKYKIEIDNTLAGTGYSKPLAISELQINTIYANNGATLYNVVFDNVFEGITEQNVITDDKIELKIGDSDIVQNSSAITYDSNDNHLTGQWARNGKTELKSIQELIIQSYFNRFGGNARQLKLSVHDPNNTISHHKKVLFDGNVYVIQDITTNVKKSWTELRLQRISTTDIVMEVFKRYTVQASQNNSGGDSSGGSSASQPTVIIPRHGTLPGLDANDHPQYGLVTNVLELE